MNVSFSLLLSFQNARLAPSRVTLNLIIGKVQKRRRPGQLLVGAALGGWWTRGKLCLGGPCGMSFACLPLRTGNPKKREAPGGGNLDASEENQWTRVGGTRHNAHRLLPNSLPHLLRNATVFARVR